MHQPEFEWGLKVLEKLGIPKESALLILYIVGLNTPMIVLNPYKKYFSIHLGCHFANSFKRWPVENYLEVANQIFENITCR